MISTRHSIRRLLPWILAFLLLPLMALGDETRYYTSVDELRAPGIRLGVQTGTSYDLLTRESFPESTILYYSTYTDLIFQLKSGALDAYAISEVTARELLKSTSGLAVLPEVMEELDICAVLPKNDMGEMLKAQLDAFITRIKEDGTLDRMTEAWLEDDLEYQVTDYESLEPVNGMICMATDSTFAPFTFRRGEDIVGLDMDLMIRFCREAGYGLEVIDMGFDALIPSLGTRADIALNGITYSDERAEKVLFTIPYSSEKTVMLVRCPVETPDFFTSLGESFESTFIREDRWKLLTEGLWTTVRIALLSMLLGTVLGFGICLLRLRKVKAGMAVTTAFIRILQGTPIVVLLMILYYVIFTSNSISGMAVAVLAFTLNFAAYVSEIMRTGIEAVPAGQTEAALAMGYTRKKAFLRIVMPQAARHFLPVYKGEVVSLIKSTSVVGYIAVQDLTKMSDIIRSRTYDAFFPLITTALIYFAVAALLGRLVSKLEISLEPDRVHRGVKGVQMK